MEYQHIPIMLKEVLEYLDPHPGQNFIDCTLGGGGYTFAIAERIGKTGKMLAIDLDKAAIKNAKKKVSKNKNLSVQAGKNIILVHDNFRNLYKIVQKYRPGKQASGFAGIIFDLGLSSFQLQDRSRGFSFQLDGPLDMRFAHTRIDTKEKRIATNYDTEYIVNKWKAEELEKIFREYGEERYARRIAKAMVQARRSTPIKTTGQLVNVIEKAVPPDYRNNKKIHFATRTFQALRIATNQELDNLKEALLPAVDLLKTPSLAKTIVDRGGRIVVISYHSLEDRIVKQFFKRESKDCICPPESPICQCNHKAKLKILTRKVVVPSAEEIKNNRRARSAKMRVAERI